MVRCSNHRGENVAKKSGSMRAKDLYKEAHLAPNQQSFEAKWKRLESCSKKAADYAMKEPLKNWAVHAHKHTLDGQVVAII